MTADPTTLAPAALDLDSCAREPIRIPGRVQPHGALLVFDPSTLEVLQASTNLADLTGYAFDPAAGATLEDAVGASPLLTELKAWLKREETAFLRRADVRGRPLQALAHRSGQGVILEFEDSSATDEATLEGLYPRLRLFMDRVTAMTELDDILDFAVAQVRELTGFDRVMAYSFEPSGDGTVVAECGDSSLPSYLGLRFPASDIPPQARELYKLNRLRLIPTADYAPAAIVPELSPVDGKPLDLSFAALRSVSPVHLEYMRNMGTGSSMSISLLVDERLWGLVSCHSREPRRVNAQVRAACDVLGQILSLKIGERERTLSAARRVELKNIETRLLASMALEAGFEAGLVSNPEDWLALVGADGAAVLSREKITKVGVTPTDTQLLELSGWLQERGAQDVLATDSLAAVWPQARAFADVASGVLAVPISEIHASYLLWFRPEQVRTVTWGGDPSKPAEPRADRLHPRKSFEAWKEQVRLTSRGWSGEEIDSARGFRRAILNLVLRQAEERAELTDQLERINKELESFAYSISHDLRAPFRHIVGYAELLSDREKTLDEKSRHYLDSIIEAALSAGRMVDDLLNFSHLGRASLVKSAVDVNKLLDEIRRSMAPDLEGRNVEWRVGALPIAWGDASLLRQALGNLIDNAVKYSRDRDPAVITVEGRETPTETVYAVSDNGVGFDMTYAGKLFGVFQRLHRVEEFEGTGIGLALTKRVLERHGGWITASSVLGQGATFTFAIPKRPLETTVG